MTIAKLEGRQILDSRGQWTVETRVTLASGSHATASVPQGKSTGSHEAHALPAALALKSIVQTIAPAVTGTVIADQVALDGFLRKLDGTPDKSRLGANAVLAVSVAYLRASAEEAGRPLWRHIRDTLGMPVPRAKKPRLYMNMINGGLHAGSNLRFQEYLLIPKPPAIRAAVDAGVAVYHALGDILARRKGKSAVNLGDEGGFAPDCANDAEPFALLREAARSLGLADAIDLGLDAAATNVKDATAKRLATTYLGFKKRFDLFYLEDPFAEEDFESFADLLARVGPTPLIAGDDLTTTNVARMEKARAHKSVNAVIIKPNQIGSVTEALDAVRTARRFSWKVVASHRSGETNDDFIADFAYGVGADGLKLGAPVRGERVAKYNRLLAIEEEARRF